MQHPVEIARLGISLVMEGRRIFEHQTVHENLLIGAHVRSDRSEIKRDLDMLCHYFPRLVTMKNRVSGYLSGGEQQMLVIGSSLMSRPKLMLLDEPSLGLSPLLIQEIFSAIRRMNEEQKTSMLLVEQNARASLDIAE
jgi:branched-chain amino acid transport system ATP-binding protein